MVYCRHIIFLFLFIAGWAFPVSADMVYPARLELLENRPGLFQVQFNLPVQNMTRIKAIPVLPAACTPLAPPEETVSATNYSAVWQVDCSTVGLFGQTVGVDGLLGSQTDVLLSIKTRDGRHYNNVLKPARARYVIPAPPSLMQLSATPLIDGMRTSFMRVDLVLLLWLIVVLDIRRRKAIGALVVGGIAYGTAQILVHQNLFLLPASLPAVVILLTIICSANRLAYSAYCKQHHIPALISGILIVADRLLLFPARMFAEKLLLGVASLGNCVSCFSSTSKKQQLSGWVIGVLIGALYGGSLQKGRTILEFSRFEQAVSFSAYLAGIITGLLVLFFLFLEFRQLLRVIGIGENSTLTRILGTLTGVIGMGLLVHQLSMRSLLSTLTPTVPPLFFVMAAILGVYAGRRFSGWLVRLLLIVVPLAAGMVIGAKGFELPHDSVVVPLILFALAFTLVIKRAVPGRAVAAIIFFATFISAAQTGLFIQTNLSRPIAQMAGNAFLASVVFLLSCGLSAQQNERFSPLVRLVGGVGAAVALLVWGQGYVDWLQTTFISEYAMGFIRIPLLSLVLLSLAIFSWPRHSRVTAHLNTTIRKPIGHIVLLVLALFLSNIITVQARNPLFNQETPRPEQAKQILETVLTNTYSAFNLKDEEQQYNQLFESVGDELVEDLYLDSRRRLSSGVRQGSEVTVTNVSVLTVSDPFVDSAGITGQFVYQVEWVVTARVRHLQHIHHRKNMYTGVLTLQVNDGKWKVQQVDLQSEERAIVQGAAV